MHKLHRNMKDTKDMNLEELADKVFNLEYCANGCVKEISDRLYELHEQTRWIKVSERMPTEEDGKYIHVFDGFGLPFTIMRKSWDNYEPTHWQRIMRPTL